MKSQLGSEIAMRVRSAALFAFVGMALVLAIGGVAAPHTAYAAGQDALAAGASELSAQAGGLAASDAATINKTAVNNAKALVKASKATSGSAKAKLKRLFTFIATDAKWKGKFSFDSYLSFWMKANATEKAKYYNSAAGPKTMKGLYKKYAIDAYKLKKASCYHYAALFAVAAKQALGKSAAVGIAVGTAKMKNAKGQSYWNDHHSWVEVKLGATTYVYDTQQGNVTSKNAGQKSAFGKYCGSKKSAMKAIYKNYKGAKYCTVTL